ncbi:MAG: 2-amino-4-hydroxy-6-hydroxymethyldihydropteridine diphosphokinase [Candidatus Dormibacteraeota bacterium]|nr:2-amino-4-hydroxy-6-hydroxymethyldihydropteridine diphosphokinase [Candidatus Dormibacteraeota bacterium]
MTVAYLAAGSNLGDRDAYLGAARGLLEARGARILRASSVIETEPWGVLDQPRFLNQVLEVDWPGSARELLQAAQAVEAELGRTSGPRWGPREIDLDVLLFGDLKLDEPGLTLPHPRMWERDFVTIPLRELRPDLTRPSD